MATDAVLSVHSALAAVALSSAPVDAGPVESQSFCVTTAINYANGLPHMGHAYEAISADVLARYHRAYGRRVLFMTGSDEHGQKIAETAALRGVSPLALCNEYVSKFQELNERLMISYDVYNRTTSQKHRDCCQLIFNKSQQAGDIYLGSYEGWYNVREETFVTETEAAATEYMDPVSGKPLKKMLESSYFFKQSKYQAQLIEYIQQHPDFIQPEARRNDILSRLQREPLLDLSISRTTFDWGIPVPDDPKHVMYVWFDALTNYLTGCDHPDGARKDFWPASVHIIGKDIIWFHCVIWPCMLWSAGLPLPQRVFGHGFVTASDGQKMSKSIGNVVDPLDVLAKCTPDTFRYYLTRGAVYGSDVPYSEEVLQTMHNADLADTLGNLVHRAANLCLRFCGGAVPDVPVDVVFDVEQLRASTERLFAGLALQQACEAAINAVKETNKYLTDKAPWHMKEDGAGKAVVVRSVLEATYILAHFLAPYIPAATEAIFSRLATPPRPIWRLQPDFVHLAPGTPVQSGDVLFVKFEPKAAEADVAPAKPAKKAAVDAPVDASRLEIRVGKVLTVEPHPDAEHLFVESVDLGEPSGPRTVVSGLVKFMRREELLGARVLCLCNLKPATMRGVVSQAMVLAASNAEHTQVELLLPPEGAPVGELLSFPGFPGAPDAQLNPKKKVWEAVQPDLRTSAERVALFRDSPFTTSAGVCTAATLAHAVIK